MRYTRCVVRRGNGSAPSVAPFAVAKHKRRTRMRLIWECSFDALLDCDRKMRDAGHRGGSESTQLGECVV
jgi:hypothetical protein